MLIRLLELNYENDSDIYEDAKFLAAYKEQNYAEFIRTIKELKDNGEEFKISVGEEWYAIDTYVFNFPKDDEHIPCINVYVM